MDPRVSMKNEYEKGLLAKSLNKDLQNQSGMQESKRYQEEANLPQIVNKNGNA